MDKVKRDRLLRLTRYWRAIQVAAALEGKAEDLEDGRPFGLEQFKTGKAPSGFVAEAFAKADAALKEDDPPVDTIDVLMTPFRIVLPQRSKSVPVVFAHGQINRKGDLLVKNTDAEIPPIWIARPFFAPTDLAEIHVFPLGDAEEYYQHLQSEFRDIETWPASWADLLRKFEAIWDAVAPGKPSFWQYVSEWPNLENGMIWVEPHDPKMLTIIGMYDRLIDMIREDKVPALYRELVYGNHQYVCQPLYQHEHLGQMGDKNPLAPSQRTALHSYLGSLENGITAVNGPPGTGKTTLLQSVVASEMVRRALAEAEPPLFVASAATNQAVSNIIDAFRKATGDLKTPLADRWIPGIGRRYGVYFRGSKGESEALAKGSLVCFPHKLQSQRKIEEAEASGLAETFEEASLAGQYEISIETILALAETEFAHREFVAKARTFIPQVNTVEEVVAASRSMMHNCADRVKAYCTAVDAFKSIAYIVVPPGTDDLAGVEKTLVARITLAKAELKALKDEHVAQRRDERQVEARQRKNEDAAFAAFVEAELEAQSIDHEHTSRRTAELADLIAKADDAAQRFRPLAAPSSFWGWFAELLPWVKNRKMGLLQEIAFDLGYSGSYACPDDDLKSAREWMRAIISRRKEFKAAMNSLESGLKERRRLSGVRQQQERNQINQQRKAREEQERVREASRARLEAEAEQKLQVTSSRVEKWRDAVAKLMSVASTLKKGVRLSLKLSEIEGLPDTTARVTAFLWATHYWEGRFLLEVRRIGWRDQSTGARRFRLIAMIAPCFVSTFDKLATAYNRMGAKRVVTPLWELADTLIIDEAGQASPDKGAFAFAFAKKALVVGDTLQLPPVTSEDCAEITRSTAESLGLLDDDDLIDRGVLSGKVERQASPGSIMRMATVSSWCHLSAQTQGLWLRDHFRCDDRIVAFSNEIWYTGEKSLVPRRQVVHKVGQKGAEVARWIPPFGHVHVDGRRVNNVNVEEIDEIFEWIRHHGPELQRTYHKPIEEIVAVVTPFANQKWQFLYKRDSYRWGKTFDAPGLDTVGNPKKIKMGTVHVLQGAERPIVLFSTVYTDDGGNYYFDREHTLMNVAVTRAQDSFIVFGHRSVFAKRKKSASKPSTHLREHLFEKGYEDVPLVPR